MGEYMQVGDQVTGVLLGGAVVGRGTIVGMETGSAIVEFPPVRPFAIDESKLISDGLNRWKVYFNSKADIPDRRG
jgi:hypothetical protein